LPQFALAVLQQAGSRIARLAVLVVGVPEPVRLGPQVTPAVSEVGVMSSGGRGKALQGNADAAGALVEVLGTALADRGQAAEQGERDAATP
jgi:hypothetical protein